jgi:hypothetical protein
MRLSMTILWQQAKKDELVDSHPFPPRVDLAQAIFQQTPLLVASMKEAVSQL